MKSMKQELRNLPEPQTMEDLTIEEQNITVEKLKYFLPKGSKVNVTQSTVDWVNKAISESGIHKGLMEERLMSYLHLMGPGIGLKQVLNGVQFVTLSMTPGLNQTKAFLITFPEKAQELLEQNRDASSFASQYAATKVPTKIMEGIQMGTSTTYAPLRHQMVEKLIQLTNGKAADGPASATVQLNATIALMDYIKVPEELTVNLNHNGAEEAKQIQQTLADEISNMAAIMAQRRRNGEDIRDIQKIGVTVDAEVIEDEN